MEITYNKNPLLTTVYLDDNEKIQLWLKIKIAQMEESLSNIDFSLEEGEYFNLEEARKYSKTDDYYDNEDTNKKSPIDKRCDVIFQYYIEALHSAHVGDCTSVACSCMKCIAENLIGIQTMPNMKSNVAHYIDSAFGKNNENTLEEAIEELTKFHINLEDYQSESWKKAGGAEPHIERWKQEKKLAHDWLVDYKNTHFKENLVKN